MDKISEMPTDFRSVKDRLLNEFSRERERELNTSRVENFILQEGLQVKPYIIFDREELPKVREIVGNTGLIRSTFNNGECGLYSPEMDLVLIVRDKDYEKASGVIYTEGLLAHELAHASSMYQNYVTADYKGFYTPRVGFCLPQNDVAWGWLLEEGWADMHRANYFAQNASEEERTKLKDALHFGEIGMEDTVPITTPAGELLPIPTKYLYITPEGKPTTKSSAYAGYALELLCDLNPEMRDLLVEGRSSIGGLKKLTQAIEEIMPGLYKKLQTSEYTEASFSEKLSVVLSITGGIEKAIQAKDSLEKTWNNLSHKS